jgi:hypothetical protein
MYCATVSFSRIILKITVFWTASLKMEAVGISGELVNFCETRALNIPPTFILAAVRTSNITRMVLFCEVSFL